MKGNDLHDSLHIARLPDRKHRHETDIEGMGQDPITLLRMDLNIAHLLIAFLILLRTPL